MGEARKADIRRKYRELALKHHPDKAEDKEAAAEAFKEIRTAYEIIKDTDGERHYDWENNEDKQQTMTGKEAVKMLGQLGNEACQQHYMYAMQLRHMANCATKVQVLLFGDDSAN